ncbi:ciliary-associated calcium-binding coiled-coil protein 1 isoform X2 [Trichomycterus rosablanca]|uniref:ciliary-associated calcium-binding coiled-coil protein 1 isoform X2 n=1 Tax=Trichomycterus rosablanca TaxID=2290929 RepID=UPI002F35F03E
MSGRERARQSAKSPENLKNTTEEKDSSLNNKAAEMFLQWPPLSPENMNRLMELSVEEVQLFEEILGLKKTQTCVSEAALLDYFVAGFWWAKEMNFTSQQISFIMALLQLLCDNIGDKHMQFADNFKEFTQTLLTTRRSATEADDDFNPLFDSNQIKSITDYFKSSLFQHYRLFEVLFTHPRDEMLHRMERNVEVVDPADFAAPLEEGMPSDLFLRYVAPAPATPPGQDQGPEKSVEKTVDEPGESEQAETPENLDFSVEDVREVLEEVVTEMLAKLQADFTKKLQIQEENYTAQIQNLKKKSK